jgi:hypothetical protein
MAKRGTWDIITAFRDRLKEIQGPGAGYWLDLGSRVYTREITPDRGTTLPYALLTLTIEDPATFPRIEEGVVEREQILTVVVFVPETLAATTESTAMEYAAKIQDDITKALMKDWRLGGKVDDTRPGTARVNAGDGPWGVVLVQVAFRQRQDVESLGP